MNTIDIIFNKNLKTENFSSSLSLKKINRLLDVIEKHFTKNLEINFESIYSKCHELCQSRLSDDLLFKLDDLISKIVKEYCEVLSKTYNSDEFLFKFDEVYITFKTKSLNISDALSYLDRMNIRFKITELTVYETCMLKLFNEILSNDGFKNKIIQIFFDKLSKMRIRKFISDENSMSDPAYVYDLKILRTLVEFKNFRTSQNFEKYKIAHEFYYKDFIEKLKNETVNFYHDYIEKCIINNDNQISKKLSHKHCVYYLNKISEILSEEETLWSALEDEKTKILELIIDKLLIDKIEFLFQKGVRKFLHNSNFHMMKIIYNLFFKYVTNETFKNKFYENFQMSILNNLKETDINLIRINKFNKIEYINFYQYVDELFEKKKKFLSFLQTSFDSNPKIEQIIKHSFEKVINKHEDFLENFVQLLHEEIKISIKTRNNSVKEFNEKFLTIFKSINDKDYFDLQYRKYMAKRLLRNTSMMRETEYVFYFLIEKQSGSNFVKKMQNMFNDIHISQELNLEYRNYLMNNRNDKSNLIEIKTKKGIEIVKESNNSMSNKISVKKKKSYFNLNNNLTANSYSILSNSNNTSSYINPIDKRKSETNYKSSYNKNKLNLNSNTDNKLINNYNDESSSPIDIYHKTNTNCFNITQNLHNNNNINRNNSTQQSDIDFYVKILSHDNWPIEGITIKTNRRDSFNLLDINKTLSNSFQPPKIINSYIDSFSTFYYNKFKNRQLTWGHSLSWAEVHGKFMKNTYSFIVSAIQAAILFLFNTKTNYSYEEIKTSLNINKDDSLKYSSLPDNIKRLIKCGLLKISNTDKIFNLSNNDIIEINHKFKSDITSKLILNVSNKKEIAQYKIEDKEISHFVVEDRKHHIDSVIIKIMKKFREISFDEIKSHIIESVSNFFIPDVNSIKARLENLMERNFIKRDDDDPNKYIYIL